MRPANVRTSLASTGTDSAAWATRVAAIFMSVTATTATTTTTTTTTYYYYSNFLLDLT
jgi:hypothetical protein